MNKLLLLPILSMFIIGIASASVTSSSSGITATAISPTKAFQNTPTTFSVTINDTITNATLTSISWYLNGNLIATNAISGTSGTFTQSITSASAGTFVVSANATDNQSNWVNSSTAVSFTQAVTPTAPPTFPIQWTWDGVVYNITNTGSGGQNCASVVYEQSYVNGAWQNQYVVSPATALNVIDEYAIQFGIPSFACTSLIEAAIPTLGQQQPIQPTSPSPLMGIILGVSVIVIVAVGVWIYEKYVKE